MGWRVNANVSDEGDSVTLRLENGREVVIHHRGDHVEFDAATPEAEALRQIEQWLLAVSMGADQAQLNELALLVARLHELAPPQPD